MKAEKLIIDNHVGELQKVNDLLERLTGEWQLPAQVEMNMNLALEEIISNVIFYAFDDDNRHDITLTFTRDETSLHVQVEDEGRPFDPLKSPPPDDLDKAAEDRHVGGLGIYFVKNFMDDLSYERKGNRNILTLTKNLT